MAKKAVASLQTGKDKNFVKVIKMVKSKKNESYEFREGMVNIEGVDKFLQEEK